MGFYIVKIKLNFSLLPLSYKTHAKIKLLLEASVFIMPIHSPLTDVEKINLSAVNLMSSLTPQRVYRVALEEAQRLVGAPSGTIFLEKDGVLSRVFSTVPEQSQFSPRPEGHIMQVYQSGKPRYVSLEEIKKNHPETEYKSLTSIILIPLAHTDHTRGVMAVRSQKELPVTDQNNLRLFGTLVSLAIRNVELYEQRKQALQARDQFISLVSHELKTPLATIGACAQLIQRKMKKGQPVNSKWLNTINHQVNSLAEMINSLFTTNQITLGSLEYQRKPIHVIEFLDTVVKDFDLGFPQHVLFENKLKENYECLKIIGDEPKLVLMLQNIVGNASKYSPNDSTIIVRAEVDDHFLSLCVSDEGQGISPKDIDRLYEKFYQGSNKQSGLGLGLFIVRDVVEHHYGKITLDSKKGKGTRFKVLLPLDD